MQSRTQGYIIVATALAFLAACGGHVDQGSTPKATMASSAPSQPTTGEAQPDPITESGEADIDTKALNPAHLNRRGVSAELFAAMLLQGGSSSVAPLVSGARGFFHEMAPTAPAVDASHTVGTGGTRTHQITSVSGMWGDWAGGYTHQITHFLPFYGGATNDGSFTRISSTLPVDLNPASHTSAKLAGGGVDLSPLAGLAGGTRILSLDAPVTVESQLKTVPKVDLFAPPAFADSHEPRSLTLTAQLPGILRRGQRIDYQNVVQNWLGADNARVNLVVLADNRYDRARLCLNTVVPGAANRTSCTIWQIPANWRPGTALTYRGHHVVDSRTYSGQRAQRSWQTLPPDSGSFTPIRVSGGRRAAAPAISDTAITGEVLATMLTQETPAVRGGSWSSAGLDGHRLSEPAPMGGEGPSHRSMFAVQAPVFEAPNDTPAFSRSIWLSHRNWVEPSREPHLSFLPYRELGFTLHLTANLGHFPRDAEGKVSGFSLADLQSAGTGTPILSLAQNAYADIGFPVQTRSERGNFGNRLALAPVTGRQLRKGVAIGFGDTVQRWQTLDGTRLSLSVLRGRDAREAQACLTLEHADRIGRRSCSIWQIPLDWQPGQPLTYLGMHISDRRTHIHPAGGTDHLYWMGTPD